MMLKRIACALLIASVAASAQSCAPSQPADATLPPATEAPATQAPAATAAQTATEAPAPPTAPSETPAWTVVPAPAVEDLPFDKLPAPKNLFTFDDYPKIDGSTATRPLSRALAYLMTGEKDAGMLELLAAHTNTSRSYFNLIEKQADLLLSYEPDAESAKEIEASDVKLLKKPIGRDALVFLTNEGNGVGALTTQQVQDIYGGKITNWKDVGGADETIVAFQRVENSGSQALMKKLVMKDLPMVDAPMELRPEEMGELIDVVKDYENTANALGYSVYYYARNMYHSDKLKFLSIDGVTPDNATIGGGQYPFVNEFYCVIRADEPADSPAHKLFDLMTGDEGKQLVDVMGYVPVK